jgi:hypothetical protein
MLQWQKYLEDSAESEEELKTQPYKDAKMNYGLSEEEDFKVVTCISQMEYLGSIRCTG